MKLSILIALIGLLASVSIVGAMEDSDSTERKLIGTWKTRDLITVGDFRFEKTLSFHSDGSCTSVTSDKEGYRRSDKAHWRIDGDTLITESTGTANRILARAVIKKITDKELTLEDAGGAKSKSTEIIVFIRVSSQTEN